MPIPGFLAPIIQYYIVYGPSLIIASLVLGVTYMFISNFSSIRSAYLCTSLKNVVNGEVGKCFNSRIGPTCKSSDIGFTHGWCNDEDNYGPLRGTRAGPHTVKCRDWIWNKSDCPPENCSDITGSVWGWCADKGVQRGMRGQPCGPYSGSCENWLWQAKACPAQCGSSSCTDDSCICTMVKARYVILKRDDKKTERINVKEIEVYDSNGYRIKGFRVKLWPLDEDSEKTILITKASRDAYIQLDLGEDKPLGRIVIRNRTDCCDGRIIGCALVLRKDNNSTALYRKITEAKAVYDIPIGKAKPVQKPAPVAPKPPIEAPPTVAPVPAPAPVKLQVPDVWKNIPGKLKHISVDPQWTWGVNGNDDIFKCKTPCEGQWTQVDGKLKQIDVGSNEVFGVNSADNIYRRPKDGSGKWRQVPGGLKHISSGPTGKVWGVNSINDIYTLKSDGNWRQIDGKLKQIDVGPDEVWGVNGNDDIWTRPNDGSGAWKKIPGKLKYVSVSRDKIVGVNAQDNIFTCQQPCNGNWQTIDGKLKQIDATSNQIVGVNSSNDIFNRVKGSL